MEPQRQLEVTLTDVLDRLLDKGLVLNADVIISVAGIPLIGLTLRAALAGMETMLDYGLMRDWDEATRNMEGEQRRNKAVSLLKGEKEILKMFGSYSYSKGIYMAWRSGWLYLTDRRLFLYQQSFSEVIFEVPLRNLRGIVAKREAHKKREVEVLYLVPRRGKVIQLKAQDVQKLKQEIEKQAKKIGYPLEDGISLGEVEERELDFLMEGESVSHRARIWHLILHEGALGDNWRPGHLYLTDKRLLWWYEFERKIRFEVPIDNVVACTEEIRDLSGMLTHKSVLDVIYASNGTKSVASFSGQNAEEWNQAIRQVLIGKGKPVEDEIETCPRCGKEAKRNRLLEKGCKICGWTSPLLRQEVGNILRI